MNQPQYQTRRPTGQVSWPIIILAGVEGSGKTWAAAEATGAEFIDRAFFLEVGERMADEYGTVPGADYEVIEHDGTWGQILGAARWAAQRSPAPGKANMLIVDSVTEVWTLLSDVAQHMANDRARRKNRGNGGDAQITMDLWNQAKDALADFLGALRSFPGPVILTARLDNVSVVEGGKPTGEHVWKIRAEKNLPYQATVICQARAPRDWMLTKIASTRMQLPPGGELKIGPEFKVTDLLEQMGVTDGSAGASTYVRPSPDGTPHHSQAQRQAARQAAEGFLDRCRDIVDREELLAMQGEAKRLGVYDQWVEIGKELAVNADRAERREESDPETVDAEVVTDDGAGSASA
ncbi:AAA family ATPase [Corynebacterium nuruki]|uniref:AAA family ATPase n=1 Tax=Corynebacterium nuruki TaxID=1032851 RepID=UPI0002485E40|nr:AAA family ATPase [Corynebacterium nuruki]